jgi:hypothetical protein
MILQNSSNKNNINPVAKEFTAILKATLIGKQIENVIGVIGQEHSIKHRSYMSQAPQIKCSSKLIKQFFKKIFIFRRKKFCLLPQASNAATAEEQNSICAIPIKCMPRF